MGWEAWFTASLILTLLGVLATTRVAPDMLFLGGLVLLVLVGIVPAAKAFEGLANQRLGEIFSIKTWGSVDAGELAQAGQEVDAGENCVVIDPTGGRHGGPANEKRHSHTTFVQAALAAPKRTGTAHAAVTSVGDEDLLGSVVTREQHQGVLGQPVLIQEV